MDGFCVKKKEEMFIRKSDAVAVVFTDSSVASSPIAPIPQLPLT